MARGGAGLGGQEEGRNVRCPKCGADVDPLRDFCRKCGTSTEAAFREQERRLERGRAPEELKRNRMTVLGIGAGVLVLMAAAGKMSFPAQFTIHRHHEVRGPVVIGAAELFEAYHSDSHAADRRFGDREMVVTGEFVRTVPDGYGSIDMRLRTNHPDTPLGIDLDNHSVDAATKLERGQAVTVSCRRVAGSGDDPWLQDCVLQPPKPADAAALPSTPAAPAAPAAPAPPG